MNLINIEHISKIYGEKVIFDDASFGVQQGDKIGIVGINGTGKSTLGYALMGNPRYTVREGEIWFDGKNITEEAVNERAKAGIFLSFQNPLEVPGVTLSSFIRNALEQKTGKRIVSGISRRSLREPWRSFRWIHHMQRET